MLDPGCLLFALTFLKEIKKVKVLEEASDVLIL